MSTKLPCEMIGAAAQVNEYLLRYTAKNPSIFCINPPN
jgi:hypothetical protein